MSLFLGTSPIADSGNAKANTSLSNLTNTGKNIANWSNNVTNCITEIPQDIKLELNNGTLILKAGSKVYVPNGAGRFDEITINQDYSGFSWLSDTQPLFLFFNRDYNAFDAGVVSRATSGTLFPDSPQNGDRCYRTDENKIYVYRSTGWGEGESLPLGIISGTGSLGEVKSIDQVFNGFGYIGSTVFALPGVKGLIPNGRNADGTLKNIEFVNDRVRTFTASGSGYGLTYFLNPDITNLSVANTKAYAEKDTELTTFDNNMGVWFDTKQNIMLLTNDSGTTWTRVNYVYFSYMFMTNAGHLDYLVSKTPFHAVDYNDSSTISGWSMPSSRYIDLTLGASGATYTAPANGWVFLRKYTITANRFIGLYIYDNIGFSSMSYSPVANKDAAVFIPVKKGQVFSCYYNMDGGTAEFRFVYAEGEENV